MPADDVARAVDLEDVRRRKIERYRRVAQLAKQGTSFPKRPVEASTQSAEDMVRRFPVACLEFWANWCAPCLKMKPVVDELAQQFWGDIAFVRVSLDESPEARDRWNVTVLPTMIVTRGGHEATRRQGALTRRRLEAFLSPFAGPTRAPRGEPLDRGAPSGPVRP